MGISPLTVTALHAAGHDVQHVANLGMARAPDSEIVTLARRERRTIVTADLDFSGLMAQSNDRRPSVVTLRLVDFRPLSVNPRLIRALAEHNDALENGALVTVTERAVRVRSLPI